MFVEVEQFAQITTIPVCGPLKLAYTGVLSFGDRETPLSLGSPAIGSGNLRTLRSILASF